MLSAQFFQILTIPLISAQNTFKQPSNPTLVNIIADWRNPKAGHPYAFPNDLTRDTVPIGVHSHNDFWRDVPLFSALRVGAISVEADVFYWKLDNESSSNLYVGHDVASLTEQRTLKSLYVDPLIYVLQRNNPNTPFMQGNSLIHGVYSIDVLQPLYLFIDFHTSFTSDRVKETLLREIDGMIKKNYTTSVRKDPTSGDLLYRYAPVTIVLTGSNGGESSWEAAPTSSSPSVGRPYFFDGSLLSLRNSTEEGSKQTTEYSVIASGDFMEAIGGSDTFKPSGDTILTDEQRAKLKSLIDVAHAKGMLARFWNTPAWPPRVRKGIWRELVELGVDLLNADDLEEASKGDW